METLLAVRSLTKRFGVRTALDRVSLELHEGEVLGLLGPNGAGKTTLVRSVAGRVQPDGGEVILFGRAAPARDSASRRGLGWVPQEIALYPLLSVRENLAVFGRFQGLSGAELERGIARALEWSGLAERQRDRTKSLSGGMKRRLNMAAGLIDRPKLILMDEPTVGVDPQSREKIYTMIEEIKRERVGIIYTTHYMEEAERLCDRIAVIDHGKVIADGPREELIANTIGNQREARIVCAKEPDAAFAAFLQGRGAWLEGTRVMIPIRDPKKEIEDLFREFDQRGAAIVDFSMKLPSLESVFLHLTGRELRE